MATPSFRNAQNASTSGSQASITITKPTGTASGDVLYCTISYFTSSAPTIGKPTGWVNVGTQTDGSSYGWAFFRKVAGGSEGANYQFTFSPNQNANGSIYCWQNVDNTTPEDATSQSHNASANTVAINSVTPTVSGGIQLALMTNFNGPYNAAPSGWTQDNTDGGASNGEDHRNATLTSGSPSGSATQSLTATTESACLSIALKPTGTAAAATSSTLALMGVG